MRTSLKAIFLTGVVFTLLLIDVEVPCRLGPNLDFVLFASSKLLFCFSLSHYCFIVHALVAIVVVRRLIIIDSHLLMSPQYQGQSCNLSKGSVADDRGLLGGTEKYKAIAET